jgi:hypothetical protein
MARKAMECVVRSAHTGGLSARTCRVHVKSARTGTACQRTPLATAALIDIPSSPTTTNQFPPLPTLHSPPPPPLSGTDTTANIITRRLGVDPSRIVRLELGSRYEIPLDERGGVTATVTLYDANHCPGECASVWITPCNQRMPVHVSACH